MNGSVTTRLEELGVDPKSTLKNRIINRLKEDEQFNLFFVSREQELLRKQELVSTGRFYSEKSKESRDSFYKALSEQPKIYSTKEGDFSIPDKWKLLLGEDCLNLKISLNLRLKNLGLEKSAGLRRRLSKIEEFREWMSQKEQIRLSTQEKYGVANILSLPEVRAKARSTSLSKYGTPFGSMLNENQMLSRLLNFGIVPVSSIPTSCKQGIVWRGKCTSCKREFDFRFTSEAYPTVCPFCNTRSTSLERNIAEFICSLGLEVIQHYYVKGQTQELDIFIPELNIAFEINGMFSHNSGLNFSVLRHNKNASLQDLKQGVKSPSYHVKKSDFALNAGIKLYHIWENWPKEIIFSLVRAKCKYFCRSIQARKCEVSFSWSLSDINLFYSKSHVQGPCIPTFSVSLIQDNHIVQAISFKKVSTTEFSLVRNATLPDTQVLGGFKRLFKHAVDHIKKNYPEVLTIVTYANRDLTPSFEDSVYVRNNFNFVGDSGPTMQYYCQSSVKRNGEVLLLKGVHNRQSLMKYKLTKFEGASSMFTENFRFDKNKTEQQLLEDLAVVPVYNSGCFKFVFKIYE